MSQPFRFSLEGFTNVGMTLFICLFMGFSAFAQGEKERQMPETARSSEALAPLDNQEASTEAKSDGISKSASTPRLTNGSVKKENTIYKQGGEKDGKKEEISTLSFNLFLYIVDKFKED